MSMCVARLLDLEGRTMAEVGVSDPPPPYLDYACAPKITAMVEPEEPVMLAVKAIRYELERRAGDGVLIYRRTTGPWG